MITNSELLDIRKEFEIIPENSTDIPHLLGRHGLGCKMLPRGLWCAVWRAGIYSTIRNNGGTDDTAQYLQGWLEASRVAPTHLISHTMWHCAFVGLHQRGTDGVATSLQRHYFFKILSTILQLISGFIF